VLRGVSLAQAIAEVVKLPHVDHLGRPRTLFARTVYRWMMQHRKGEFSALEDQRRGRTADSVVLSRELLDFLRRQHKADEKASVPELIRLARAQGVIASDQRVDRTSVWRACRRMGMALTRSLRQTEADVRSFAYPNRMLMVLCDGKHFRAGVKRLRRVVLSFLDDATRFGLDVVVGTAESTSLFLTGLHQVTARFGLMSALFLDRGSGFISDDTHTTCGRLGVAFIHGTAGYPEGHGKIEKYNQTQGRQVLRGFDGNPEVDPDPLALRARLLHYLHTIYNRTGHEGLDGDTPEQRWNADARPLVFPQDRAWLEERFVATFERTVTKDNLIPYEGTDYEVPRGSSQKTITVCRSLLRGTLFVIHEGREVVLHPVDRVANAYARRAKRTKAEADASPTPIVHTAASLAYQRDFAPLVGDDGGYPEGEDES
jgi:putative transposase